MRKALIVLAALSFSTALAADSFYGTWKLNVAKSNLQCSDIISQTMKIIETGPDSFRNISDVILKSGKAHHIESANRFLDGKEHKDGQAGVTATAQRVDASALRIVFKRDRKVSQEITAVISEDGKVNTYHRVFPGCEETLVFERQ
jgi:hypothetical protein